MFGLKNRSSLLSAASDKSKICSFEEIKDNSMKGTTKGAISKLYQKNVMASRNTVMLGIRRVNSLQAE